MQNYVKMYMGTGAFDYGGPVLSQTFVADTDANLQFQIDGTGAIFTPVYRGIVWILLNKSTVLSLVGQAFANQVTTVPGDMVFSAGSPKQVWNSDATGLDIVPKFVNYGAESATGYVSKTRKPVKLDFTGAQGIYDAFNASITQAKLLASQGKISQRNLGIILFWAGQVVSGQLTVNEYFTRVEGLLNL